MRYANVFFDFDGTIMKTDPGVTKSMRYAADQMGVVLPDDVGLYIGPPMYEFCREHLGLDDAGAKRFMEHYRAFYREQGGMFDCEPYPGILELMADLRAAGAKVYVATSKPTSTTEIIAQKFGVDKVVDGITGASLDQSRTHKLDVLRYALQSRNIDSTTAVMVGDKDCDLLAGKELGCAAVGVLYGYGSRGELAGCVPDALVADAAELRAILFG